MISPMPCCKRICFAESLLAGLPQKVKFTILTGHYEVKKGDALQLSNTDSMPILHSSSCSARILSGTGGERAKLTQRSKRSNDVRFDCLCVIFVVFYAFCVLYLAELVGEAALSIQASEKVTSISLPLTPPYHTLEFQLEVLCHIPLSSARVESERLTNGEIHHRPKSRTRFNSGMACIDQKVWCLSKCEKHCNKLHTFFVLFSIYILNFGHNVKFLFPQVSIDCPWSIYSILISLTFYTPFRAKHSLLSAGKRFVK